MSGNLILLISVSLMAIPVVFSSARGRPDFFSAPAIFAYGYTASYGLKAWLVTVDRTAFITYPEIFRADYEQEVAALLLAWLGLLAFYIGYYLNTRLRVFPRLTFTRKGLRVLLWAGQLGVLLGVLSAVRLAWLNRSVLLQSQSINELLYTLRNSLMASWAEHPMLFHFPIYAGFFGLVVWHARARLDLQTMVPRWAAARQFGFAALVVVTLVILGSRQYLLCFGAALFLYRHYFVRRVSTTAQIAILVALPVLGGVLGLIQRSLDVAMMSVASEMPLPRRIAFRLSSSFEQYETLADTIAAKPDLELGRTILEDVFMTYIPRVLWPSKPREFGYIRAQNVILRDYWLPSSSYPIGVLGELYLNFGWVGVPLGMAFLGALLRQLKHLSCAPDSLWPAVFVTVTATSLSPHRTFGAVLMILMLYTLFGLAVRIAAAAVTVAWDLGGGVSPGAR